MSTLPDSWAEEPWPLDDPVPAPRLRPTNWSDTHDEPPQVADLADARGISVGRALAELQDEELLFRRGWRRVRVTQQLLDDAEAARTAYDDAMRGLNDLLAARLPSFVSALREMSDRQAGDQALAEVKAAPLVPSWQWDACREDRP